jgi:putative transcriptional regulator
MSSLAGNFLVARPVLDDPNFHRSVVLLLQHGPEGAFGLVVNRPVESEKLPFPIYLGGPCKLDGMLLLHGHADWKQDAEDREVCPGVFLGDSTCAERVAQSEPDEKMRFKMFSGYSGWGPRQLESELAQKAWAIVPASGEILFDTSVEELWTLALPPTIPQPSLN